MFQSQKPIKKWLVFDDNPKIRERSIDIPFPLSSKHIDVMHKLIDFVQFSQDPIANKEQEIRPAVGLAAPQIGENLNMYYIRIDLTNPNSKEKEQYEHALINPKIVGASEQKACLEDGEGCLSVANDCEGYVPRSFKVIIEGYDFFQKKQVQIVARNYHAIVLQHEQDHLIGKLYYDYINKKDVWYKESDWFIL